MLEKLIGKTPMIRITCEYQEKKVNIYTKLEYYNLTGSIKDRVAYYIIKKAQKEGKLKKNMPIVEATSGNTGISLAAIGAYYQNPVYIFMPNWASKERIQLMKNYGANVILISKEQGGFIECVKRAKKLAEEKQGFLVNQFSNKNNYKAHFETTGREILEELKQIESEGKEIKVGGFISGVGTGGTLMGIGDRLKEEYKEMKIVALEPDKMPIISGGKIQGQHKIEGIGDDFVPDLLDRKKIDEIILVNDDDAINMSRKIARKLGIGVGISSGANLIGAVLLATKIGKDVITVFADDNKKYLSTGLSNEMEENEKFISNKIKLIK